MATAKLDLTSDLSEIYRRCWELIESRSAAYSDDPVGRTGLYRRAFKIHRNRGHFVLVEEYSLDRPLIRTLLKIMKSSAIQSRQRKQSPDTAAVDLEELKRSLAAGRERVAKMKAQRAAAAAAMNENATAERDDE